MHQLIYCSASLNPFSATDLAAMLLRARANNARLGVTGLLLHENGSFLQVLEGAEPVVRTLFRTIAADKRHARVVELLAREARQREFSDWKMGFVSAEFLSNTLPGYSHYLQVRGQPPEAGDAAARVLAAFRDGRFRTNVST